jgi:DNA-binding transcriptional ArsR family regulator
VAAADTVFKAIAHPTRRRILALLSESEHSVKQLTETFDISQPAVSQHLRELRDAGLVASEKRGVEQQYRLTGAPLRVVFEWSAQYKRFFDPSGHAWAFVPASTKGKAKHGR